MAPAPRRPASHRPRSYRWQWALLIGMALGTVMGLVACAAPPRPPGVPMAPLPAASTPSVQRVAQQVTVAGARGPLGPQRREQVLQNAAAQGKAELLQRQLAAMSALGDVDLYAGNEAKLLIDGPATFAAMFAAIAKARHQVLLESYIIEDAEISHQLADLLAERSAKGVQVAVIYDSVGSLGTQQAFFDRLHAAGVATCAFNPVNPWRRPGYFDISHRDHRKILIVDSDLGFTGGINISAVYSSGSSGSFGRILLNTL